VSRGEGTRWYVIRLELVSGPRGELDPPPGRDLLVSARHSFGQLADAINGAFARWDLSHAYTFRLPDGTEIGPDFDEPEVKEATRTKLGTREKGEVFEYEFDLGDSWMHRCIVLETGVDPQERYGGAPREPVPIWGWGHNPGPERKDVARRVTTFAPCR
jgi:hypothetical protein